MSIFDSAWSLLKNFDEKRGPIRVDPDGIDGPTTQEELGDDPYFRPQMDDDPFNMKKPDMSAQIEQILAEIQRREGRRNPDFHNQDYDSDFYRNKYDRENPQNESLMSSTGPQMNERMEALRAEMARRAGRREAKRQDVEDPDWPYSVKTFDEKNGPQPMGTPESFSAPEGMTNEEYGIIDQPDSENTKELQGQALQDYIKQRFG